jgi:hypothetical protein
MKFKHWLSLTLMVATAVSILYTIFGQIWIERAAFQGWFAYIASGTLLCLVACPYPLKDGKERSGILGWFLWVVCGGFFLLILATLFKVAFL